MQRVVKNSRFHAKDRQPLQRLVFSNGDQFVVSRQLHLGGIEPQPVVKEAVLVLHGVLDAVLVAHPLLTALPGDFHQPRVGTAQVGKSQFLGTQRNAAHGAIDTRALVFTVGLETLPVLVDSGVIFAGSAFGLSCKSGQKRKMFKFRSPTAAA